MMGQAALDAAGGTAAALQGIAYIGITPIIASYAQCAAILDRIGTVPGTKGIMLIFPECLAGLQEFGERVLPLMRTAKLAPPRHRGCGSKRVRREPYVPWAKFAGHHDLRHGDRPFRPKVRHLHAAARRLRGVRRNIKCEPGRGRGEVMERIGLGLFSYLIGHTPYKELVELSRLAEDKGFEAVVFPELVNDALACAEAVALEHTALPYNRLLRNSGLVAEAEEVIQAMARGDQQEAAACISDRMLDTLLPIGPAERCRETPRLSVLKGSRFHRDAHPIAEDYSPAVRRTLDAFAPR